MTPGQPIAYRLTIAALCGLALACVASWLAPVGWPFELFSHFRLQLIAGAALLCLALLLTRERHLAVIPAGLAVPLLVPLAAAIAPAPIATLPCQSPPFQLITANVEFTNHDHARFLRWLDDNPADLVIVQEVTPEWAQALRATVAEYPYSSIAPREDPYGLAVLSRWPLHVVAVDLAGDGLPSLLTTVNQAGGPPVHVLAMHTRWPVTPATYALRDTSLRQAAVLMRQFSSRAVLAGDLNLTPYAPAFSRLLHEGRLHDALAAEIWRPTWQAGFWPLALPIDHVLVPEKACVLGVQVGPAIGSDHRPLRATLSWPG